LRFPFVHFSARDVLFVNDWVSDIAPVVSALDLASIEYTISVPFEHFSQLKAMIENRRRWYVLDQQQDYFESSWKPNILDKRHHFVFVRQRGKVQHKEPVQLDLFIPYEFGYIFKVVLTNKALTAGKVVAISQWSKQ
jgi:hypothetical protein